MLHQQGCRKSDLQASRAKDARASGCRLTSLLGPVDPSFRALSGRLKLTVRRHKFNKIHSP